MKTHHLWIKKSLLSVSLLLLLGACADRGGHEPTDPVSKLLAVRYLKVVDDLGSHRILTETRVEGEGAGGTNFKALYEELEVDDRSSYRIKRRQRKGEAPWELVSIGSAYYVINPDGRVETLQPGMLGQHTRERVAESWRTILKDYQHHVNLVRTGETRVNGRGVVEHTIEFVPNDRAPDDANVVTAAAGKVFVDTDTGFPVKMELKGSYLKELPEGAVTVTLKGFTFSLQDFGKVGEVKQPKGKSKPKAPKGTK